MGKPDWERIAEIAESLPLSEKARGDIKEICRLIVGEPEKVEGKIEAGATVRWCEIEYSVRALVGEYIWLVPRAGHTQHGVVCYQRDCKIATPAEVGLGDTVQHKNGPVGIVYAPIPNSTQLYSIALPRATLLISKAFQDYVVWDRAEFTILLKAPKGEKP